MQCELPEPHLIINLSYFLTVHYSDVLISKFQMVPIQNFHTTKLLNIIHLESSFLLLLYYVFNQRILLLKHSLWVGLQNAQIKWILIFVCRKAENIQLILDTQLFFFGAVLFSCTHAHMKSVNVASQKETIHQTKWKKIIEH